MRMFGKQRGVVVDADQPKNGEVVGRVEIHRIDRSTRDVKAILVDCTTSKTIYKATYTTQASTDFYAYNHASEDLKRVIERENYILRGNITSNAELPFVRNVDKRSR